MLAKTRAKILELREGKRQLLQEEYDNFQRYLRGDKTAKLYSATRQQADREVSDKAEERDRMEAYLIQVKSMHSSSGKK